MTGLDVFFLVEKYRRYASNATLFHNVALKKIDRYLKKSKKISFKYSLRLKNKDRKLFSYTDALYGDCLDTQY